MLAQPLTFSHQASPLDLLLQIERRTSSRGLAILRNTGPQASRPKSLTRDLLLNRPGTLPVFLVKNSEFDVLDGNRRVDRFGHGFILAQALLQFNLWSPGI